MLLVFVSVSVMSSPSMCLVRLEVAELPRFGKKLFIRLTEYIFVLCIFVVFVVSHFGFASSSILKIDSAYLPKSMTGMYDVHSKSSRTGHISKKVDVLPF